MLGFDQRGVTRVVPGEHFQGLIRLDQRDAGFFGPLAVSVEVLVESVKLLGRREAAWVLRFDALMRRYGGRRCRRG